MRLFRQKRPMHRIQHDCLFQIPSPSLSPSHRPHPSISATSQSSYTASSPPSRSSSASSALSVLSTSTTATSASVHDCTAPMIADAPSRAWKDVRQLRRLLIPSLRRRTLVSPRVTYTQRCWLHHWTPFHCERTAPSDSAHARSNMLAAGGRNLELIQSLCRRLVPSSAGRHD